MVTDELRWIENTRYREHRLMLGKRCILTVFDNPNNPGTWRAHLGESDDDPYKNLRCKSIEAAKREAVRELVIRMNAEHWRLAVKIKALAAPDGQGAGGCGT